MIGGRILLSRRPGGVKEIIIGYGNHLGAVGGVVKLRTS
jgi:hypothetical protein